MLHLAREIDHLCPKDDELHFQWNLEVDTKNQVDAKQQVANVVLVVTVQILVVLIRTIKYLTKD